MLYAITDLYFQSGDQDALRTLLGLRKPAIDTYDVICGYVIDNVTDEACEISLTLLNLLQNI